MRVLASSPTGATVGTVVTFTDIDYTYSTCCYKIRGCCWSFVHVFQDLDDIEMCKGQRIVEVCKQFDTKAEKS